MKIHIISPGRKHELEALPYIKLFEERLSPFVSLSWSFGEIGTVEQEEKWILSKIDEKDYVVLLDECGTLFTSEDFAGLLEKRQNESTKTLVFVIGGAFGVGEGVKSRANTTLSLSKLVFPHMLVRVILTEQIYRGYSILRGSKYHHA